MLYSKRCQTTNRNVTAVTHKHSDFDVKAGNLDKIVRKTWIVICSVITQCSLTSITDRHSLVANVKYHQQGCKPGRQNVLLFGKVKLFLVISVTNVSVISFVYCKTRQS